MRRSRSAVVLPEVMCPWKGWDVCLMNQYMKMATFTVINTISSAGVWQEGSFMEFNVVIPQLKVGRETFETNVRLPCVHEHCWAAWTVHVGSLKLYV